VQAVNQPAFTFSGLATSSEHEAAEAEIMEGVALGVL
jgi:hypothetical protein